jgi:hypothetical protein
MSYEPLPDPRPFGVRVTIGPMSRLAAQTLWGGLLVICAAGLFGLVFNLDDATGATSCIAISLIAGLLAFQYTAAIRWMDFHMAWRRRRSHRREHRHHLSR